MRALTVCFAYACAAVAAIATIVLFAEISEGETNVIRNASDIRFLMILAVAAAAYALPVALPVIIVSEIRRLGDWKIFVGAGAVLGLLLAFLFSEVPFEWSNLWSTAPLVPTAIFAALVYWVVAWKWMPPKMRPSSTPLGALE